MSRYTGHRTNVVFADSGFEAELTSITPPAQTGEPIEATHLQTDDVLDFEPPDLPDAGEMQVAGHFDPAIEPPVVGAESEQVTINFPQAGKAWVFTGFWIAYEPGEATTNQRIPFTGRVKCVSVITVQDVGA